MSTSDDTITVPMRQAKAASVAVTEGRDDAREIAIEAMREFERLLVGELGGERILGMANLGTTKHPIYGARVRGEQMNRPITLGEGDVLVLLRSGHLVMAKVDTFGASAKVISAERAPLESDLMFEDLDALVRVCAVALKRHTEQADQRHAAHARVARLAEKLMAIVGSLLLVILTSCSAQPLPGPTVYVALGGDAANGVTGPVATSSWSSFDAVQVEAGALEWRHLGYDVRPIGETGTDGPTVTVHVDWGLANSNAGGSISTQAVGLSWGDAYVNGTLHGDALRGYTAHAIGHLLLHTDRSMATGGVGVMTDAPSSWDVTHDDLSFACEVRGRCDWYDDAM